MNIQGKATSLWGNFFNLKMPQMRAFHVTWLAFFLCFFAWFGIAPLMIIVRDELGLTKEQVDWTIIASVAITIFARLMVGRLCDRFGPRRTYTGLLIVSALPVMGITLASDFTSFLIFRLLIGIIGASFVVTQFHTSLMFAPNCVGTANATSAGWGNLGGGVTQLVMPLVFAFFVSICGFSEAIGWRAAMFVAGAVCLLMAAVYWRCTQDTPEGDFRQLRSEGKLPPPKTGSKDFWTACADSRVWALFVLYGACFGIELTINNIAAMHFYDAFGLSVAMAGVMAAAFGLMNVFARTLGGVLGDRFGLRFGLKGRVAWLFMAIFCEGLALMLFSQMSAIALALPALVIFSLFVSMSCGATFSVVPFVNKKALGAVSGIVGAGGNMGAVASSFLLKGIADRNTGLLILGVGVTIASLAAFAIRFSSEAEAAARRELAAALEERATEQDLLPPDPVEIQPAFST